MSSTSRDSQGTESQLDCAAASEATLTASSTHVISTPSSGVRDTNNPDSDCPHGIVGVMQYASESFYHVAEVRVLRSVDEIDCPLGASEAPMKVMVARGLGNLSVMSVQFGNLAIWQRLFQGVVKVDQHR